MVSDWNDYLDLFKFNGFNPPKFWFGDKVRCRDRQGVILGLAWRDGKKVLGRNGSQGWWYDVCLENRESLMGFHEACLEKLEE